MRCHVPNIVVVLVLAVILPADAPGGVTTEYLGPLDPSPSLTVVPQGDFIMGSLGDPVHLVTDPIAYSEYSRCAIYEPIASGCNCVSGYTINSFSFVFAKLGWETLVTPVSMSLGHAYLTEQYPPDTVCYDPPGGYGGPRYQYPFFCQIEESITVTTPGFYKVTLTGPADCGCIYTEYTQALHVGTFSMGESWGSRLFLVASDESGLCPDYAGHPDTGHMWYDEIYALGKIIMWADATCCDHPVDTESRGWGSLKALYR